MKKILCLILLLLFAVPGMGQAVKLQPGPNGILIPDYFGNVPNYANSPFPEVDGLGSLIPGTGIRKFVDALPQLNTPNALGQQLPIAVPDTVTYPGSDYYEVVVRQYQEQLHSDLPPTKLRGYVQVNRGTDANGNNTIRPAGIHYMGPIIVAQRDRPVRIKFTNKLPAGAGGNLFVPVDKTYMGAGPGPDANWANPADQECVNNPAACFTENRVSIHLHGGTTPWISDGTPHQYFTPALDLTNYPRGMSYHNVPDMWYLPDGSTVASCAGQTTCAVAGATNDPGAGSMTFYFTNQQSAKLMFYHDHAVGITRLNVYAGMASGYLVTDQVEQDLIAGTNVSGGNPGATSLLPDLGIPLVIQDRTFVPKSNSFKTPYTNLMGTFPSQLAAQDPTWSVAKWGGYGQLWYPHVYMTNQNPWDVAGANPMGRWDYGPWFWPPFTGLKFGAVTNPYYNPACVPSATTFCEPPQIPGVPNPSGVPESFMDTPIVNGTAYPTLNVDPKPYRFKILNAANDRYWNLSLWVADGTTVYPVGYSGPGNTEVKMVPFNGTFNATCPGGCFPSWWHTDTATKSALDDRIGGVPDPATRGPAMIQIGTEGGFLPGPAVIKNQPVNYDYNTRSITVLNVLEHALFLGPAERADVVIDFSDFAGKTLILYNDSPAPVPASDPRLDYYTGNPDQTDTGGAPSTLPGYGPNTRTVMQITVNGTGGAATPDFVNPTLLAALETALPAAFKASHPGEPIIVPQAPYNAVYNQTFPSGASAYVQIQDTSFSFAPLDPITYAYNPAAPVTFNLKPKSIIEDFQMDYGRMNATLGIEMPHTNVTNQTSIIQAYVDPPTELVKYSDMATPISGKAADGTQLWKITHNGVDTHSIHFHMVNLQLINRVGWDGAIKPPDANELGWKDTIRMNPLEDVIVATRPIKLNLPFGVPNSIRLLDPSRPAGSRTEFTGVDPNGQPVVVTNRLTNFGWEYVWHCHLLGHEENDMMRAMVFAAAPDQPTGLFANLTAAGTANQRVTLNWTNNAANATGLELQRATDNLFTTGLTSVALGPTKTSYIDAIGLTAQPYYYRVRAINTVGSTVAGYPQMTVNSAFSNKVGANNPGDPPAPPANFAASVASGATRDPVTLTWADRSANETGFEVQRATNTQFTQNLFSFTTGANKVTLTQNVVKGASYYFRIRSVNNFGQSNWVRANPFPIAAP